MKTRLKLHLDGDGLSQCGAAKKPPNCSGVETPLTDDRHQFSSVVGLDRFGSTWAPFTLLARGCYGPISGTFSNRGGWLLCAHSLPQMSNTEALLLSKGDEECYCIAVTFPITPPALRLLDTRG